jgi:hypothetical protein
LPSYLKTSNSGFYVNDLPGISLELIDDAKREKAFNDYVVDVHRAAIIEVVERFISRQKRHLNTKELLSNITMIQGMNKLDHTITKNGRFIGYAITPRESKSLVVTIKSVGLQSSASESLTLYLYDPSKQAAVQSKTITCTGKTINWTTLDWDIEFDDLTGSAGGTYLVGLFEDDLSGSLYEQDWSTGQSHISMKITRHYAGLSPVRVRSSHLNGVSLPNMEFIEGELSCKTSGFNLRFNVKCDITDVLNDNITMFGEAVQMAVALRYLRDALANIGLNPTISSAQNREQFEQLATDYEGLLYGGYIEDVGYRRGIIDNLSLDFSELDAVCLKERKESFVAFRYN